MELEIKYNDLFVTRIWQAELGMLAPYFEGWIKEVLSLRAKNPTPAGRSNRRGWNSTDKAVLDLRAFSRLNDVVRTCCASALDQMGIGRQKFKVEAWINMHDRGGFNFQHMHDGSLLSGSFYLQVPDGSGSLVLRDPRPRSASANLEPGHANAIYDVHLEPRQGLIVLFPYWLEHHVEPHDSDVPRISISFNALRV
jgi:uncharacterized protein (TIGR02466 family)